MLTYLVLGTCLAVYASYRPNRVKRIGLLLGFLMALDLYEVAQEDYFKCPEEEEAEDEGGASKRDDTETAGPE